MSQLDPRIADIIRRIEKRSADSRAAYLDRIAAMHSAPDSDRRSVSCSNMAHAAAGGGPDQAGLLESEKPNIAIVSAYNDMLSAHQPYDGFLPVLKAAVRAAGGTAQMAGGVPAMCDGITQGRPGMELSLISRDVIAMATGIALSHGVFDAALCLGVCDKIVPGLVMGALAFGHLPVIFVPAGPMASGIPNEQKAAVRKAFARGEASRAELLASEAAAYHGPGTCTFYGTANSNQMLMEVMGLHLPGAAFVHPHDDLRQALNVAAARQAVSISRKSNDYRALGQLLDARSFVNAIIGLHATGGSTNHTLHLPAMAAAAGLQLDWQDFADLSQIVPLLARVYPNGQADINQFHAAGGMGFVISELLQAGLLDGTARTVWGASLAEYAAEPVLQAGQLEWRPAPAASLDRAILRGVDDPHADTGGLVMLAGNIGRSVIKIAAVAANHQTITAPAAVFHSEADVHKAFHDGALNRDVVVVVTGQGPRANGMPELHALTPILGNLQDQGHKVALVTDGRMSGASGKVPAAIHVSPEALDGGWIGRIRDGDMIRLDAPAGRLEVAADLASRTTTDLPVPPAAGFGRELFSVLRVSAQPAERGGGLNLLGEKA